VGRSSAKHQSDDADHDDEQVQIAASGSSRDDANGGPNNCKRDDQPVQPAEERQEGDQSANQRDEADDQRSEIEHAIDRSIIPAAAAAAASATMP